MGTLRFELRSQGLFLETTASTDLRFNHRHRLTAAHRSKTGAPHSSQVILRPHIGHNISRRLVFIKFCTRNQIFYFSPHNFNNLSQRASISAWIFSSMCLFSGLNRCLNLPWCFIYSSTGSGFAGL